MINLLSPDDKRQLQAARTNSLLLRYAVLLGVIIGLLVLEMVGAYLLLGADRAHNQAVIADNAAKTASYASTRQEAVAFQSNLATAKYILSKQVPYNDLILTVAGVLPTGTVLDQLTIAPDTFGTATTLTVHTSSYDAAINTRQNLMRASVQGKALFDSVSFQSVATSADKTSLYGYTAIYNVTYSKAVLPS